MRIDEFEFVADHLVDAIDRFRISTIGFELLIATPSLCVKNLDSYISTLFDLDSAVLTVAQLHSPITKEIEIGDLCR